MSFRQRVPRPALHTGMNIPTAFATRIIDIAAATLAFALIPARESKAADIYAEAAPAFNDTVARSFLIEVEPLVEKYTGWDCEWPIPFQLVTREQYVNIAVAEFTQHIARTKPGTNTKAIEPQLRMLAQNISIGLLGRYSSISRKLFFFPGNLKPVMDDLGVEQRFTRDLIEVIMAHELTHSVQDAKLNLQQRRAAIRSKAEQDAFTMLVEGHATWVQERVAAELGLAESAQRFAAQMTERHRSDFAVEEQLTEANMRGYIQGKTFVAAIHAKGGLRAVQALFENPPKSPDDFENPALFLQRR